MSKLQNLIQEAIEDATVKKMDAEVHELMNDLESKYPVDLFISYSKFSNALVLSRIVVDKKQRSTGIGSKVMSRICDFADAHNLRVALTPSSDFGGSKSRLITFYKSFGFKKYRGYEMRETMVRLPNE